jgi:hypothetical protein
VPDQVQEREGHLTAPRNTTEAGMASEGKGTGSRPTIHPPSLLLELFN